MANLDVVLIDNPDTGVLEGYIAPDLTNGDTIVMSQLYGAAFLRIRNVGPDTASITISAVGACRFGTVHANTLAVGPNTEYDVYLDRRRHGSTPLVTANSLDVSLYAWAVPV
jgi:hypothetical protein